MIRLALASITAAFSLYSWYYCWKSSERKHAPEGRYDDEALLVIAGIIFLVGAELAIIYGVLQ